MDVDTRQLRAFITLAHELHFTRAARRMFMSQPTLSHHIRRLETTLGSKLFARNSREVTLTVEGERFLVAARHVLKALDDLDDPNPVLRLATLGETGLPAGVVRRLRARLPELAMTMTSTTARTQLAGVRSGGVSVGWMRLDGGLEPELCSELIRLEPLIVCRSEVHDGSPPGPISWVASTTPEVTANVYIDYMTAFAEAARVDLIAASVLRAPVAHAAATTPPGGFFLSPASLQPQLELGGIEAYCPVPLQPYYPWSLVWRADDTTPAVLEFLSVCRELAAESGWLRADPALPGIPWLPADDPHHDVLESITADWARARKTPTPDRLPSVELAAAPASARPHS